jgi:hypothetical protein
MRLTSSGANHEAEIVCYQTPVWTLADVSGTRRSERTQRALDPETQELQRNGRLQALDCLLGRGDDHEGPRRRGDDLLPRVGCAPALDQPALRVDLVRSVDRDVEFTELV